MGSSETEKSAKEAEDTPKESKTANSQEQTSATAKGTVNPDWTGFQPYPMPPHGFLASSPQAHPYMWGVQHLMPPYGTPPHPYVAMYPPGGIYAHPSMPPGSYPFSPYAMPSPNGVVEASVNTAGETEADHKSPDGKEKLPIKRSKGSLGSLNMITGKSSETNKAGASANGVYPKSAESGSEGSSEGSEGNSENVSIATSLQSGLCILQMLQCGSQMKSGSRQDSIEATGENGNSANGPLSVVNQIVPSPANLNIGMEYWNGTNSSAMRGKVTSAPVAGGMVAAGSRDNMQSQPWLQDERELKRQRRKQSNRESARRSRLRKQAECDELAQRAEALREENSSLRTEVGRLRSEYEQLLAQNESLKERLGETPGREEMASDGNEQQLGDGNHQEEKLAPQRRSQRHMGGHMQQRNASANSLYDQPADGGPHHNAGPGGDAGDAVMARWLQSAGLQHLASPVASNGIDQRLLPNILMQGYGAQSPEEKQRLFKLMRNLNFNGESASEPFSPTTQSSGGIGASDGFYSSEFRGDFGAGLLDLHAMDDTELLTESVMSEPFEQSPFVPSATKAVDNDYDAPPNWQQRGQTDVDASQGFPTLEKEINSRENNVAKIKVVVRKRPLNKKENSRKEEDVVSVCDNGLTVHEPKLKVDLTAYVEKHEFCFDAVLDQQVTNDEVYRETVQPIIPIIFQRTKATCFAYGQTGSGKTYTMQPLPLRAAEDLVRLLHHPTYRNQKFKLWLSYFEIYGGKLYDLLNDRKKLCMREDGRQQVCIVGLQEFEVLDVQIVKEYIERGNAARSTGSTGANEESSRSHAILQLVVKKEKVVKDTRRNNDANESKGGKVVGKISFIDLAGSERGADTTDNDRQTR
ncbi:hypothetical protein SSX86_011952 [Deinandra increscens subsp. villosa]|uniref:Kinesin-like protein n=1 Tax=Deinandra increscens subsp. villosa TaxID=3103831 RepID=A0AAP0D380_9ASTR